MHSITEIKEGFLQGKHINQYRKLSTNDVEDSNSSHFNSVIETKMTYEVEHNERSSNEDEQREDEELPPEADIDIINQIQTARTTLKEGSFSENMYLKRRKWQPKTSYKNKLMLQK